MRPEFKEQIDSVFKETQHYLTFIPRRLDKLSASAESPDEKSYLRRRIMLLRRVIEKKSLLEQILNPPPLGGDKEHPAHSERETIREVANHLNIDLQPTEELAYIYPVGVQDAIDRFNILYGVDERFAETMIRAVCRLDLDGCIAEGLEKIDYELQAKRPLPITLLSRYIADSKGESDPASLINIMKHCEDKRITVYAAPGSTGPRRVAMLIPQDMKIEDLAGIYLREMQNRIAKINKPFLEKTQDTPLAKDSEPEHGPVPDLSDRLNALEAPQKSVEVPKPAPKLSEIVKNAPPIQEFEYEYPTSLQAAIARFNTTYPVSEKFAETMIRALCSLDPNDKITGGLEKIDYELQVKKALPIKILCEKLGKGTGPGDLTSVINVMKECFDERITVYSAKYTDGKSQIAMLMPKDMEMDALIGIYQSLSQYAMNGDYFYEDIITRFLRDGIPANASGIEPLIGNWAQTTSPKTFSKQSVDFIFEMIKGYSPFAPQQIARELDCQTEDLVKAADKCKGSLVRVLSKGDARVVLIKKLDHHHVTKREALSAFYQALNQPDVYAQDPSSNEGCRFACTQRDGFLHVAGESIGLGAFHAKKYIRNLWQSALGKSYSQEKWQTLSTSLEKVIKGEIVAEFFFVASRNYFLLERIDYWTEKTSLEPKVIQERFTEMYKDIKPLGVGTLFPRSINPLQYYPISKEQDVIKVLQENPTA
ncbi:MAG: hypothetical protein V1837_06190 [Candidatus Woesearchaeota archaeon]